MDRRLCHGTTDPALASSITELCAAQASRYIVIAQAGGGPSGMELPVADGPAGDVAA